MKLRMGAFAAAVILLAACGTPVETSPTISLSALPVRTGTLSPPPAPVATASAPAVRVAVPETAQPETTTTTTTLPPAPSADNNWGLPYPIMHRDFDPHWDCSQFDAWLIQYGMTPIDKAKRIMVRESGCIPGVWNWHDTGPNWDDESYGLFQLNTRGSLGPALQEMCGLSDPVQIGGRRVYIDLFDAETNIRCAGVLKAKYGWKPWGG